MGQEPSIHELMGTENSVKVLKYWYTKSWAYVYILQLLFPGQIWYRQEERGLLRLLHWALPWLVLPHFWSQELQGAEENGGDYLEPQSYVVNITHSKETINFM